MSPGLFVVLGEPSPFGIVSVFTFVLTITNSLEGSFRDRILELCRRVYLHIRSIAEDVTVMGLLH